MPERDLDDVAAARARELVARAAAELGAARATRRSPSSCPSAGCSAFPVGHA
ncbi:hypothetical protein [Agromyces albus]|uniref:hypothetical protein n=1 Tax=Agromyces albus TaxID=205332 RepID=UPI00278B5895|nr:hypothetical protein [Agromyces albus]MDQ0576936.1 hypothetical protein [Agromyces albus]